MNKITWNQNEVIINDAFTYNMIMNICTIVAKLAAIPKGC